MFLKNFKEWFLLKDKLHNGKGSQLLFNEREVWWCCVGENIDIEINGKGSYFTRPILVLKKYNSYSFFGLPLSTKQKTGTWFCNFTFRGRMQNINLSQGRSMTIKRLRQRIGRIDGDDYKDITNRFCVLHGAK